MIQIKPTWHYYDRDDELSIICPEGCSFLSNSSIGYKCLLLKKSLEQNDGNPIRDVECKRAV